MAEYDFNDYEIDPQAVIRDVAATAAAQAIQQAQAEELNQTLAGLAAHNEWEQAQKVQTTAAEAQRLLRERHGSVWEESENIVGDFLARHPSFIDQAAMTNPQSLAASLEGVLPYATFEREQRVEQQRQLVQERVKRAIREAPGTPYG